MCVAQQIMNYQKLFVKRFIRRVLPRRIPRQTRRFRPGRFLSRVALQEQRGVRSAEPKRIREDVLDLRFARLIGDIVQVAIRVGVLVIDGWRQHLIAQGERGKACFQTTRPAQQMSGHGFRGAHRELFGVLAENLLDRQGFEAIVVLGGSPVGVDGIDLLGRDLGVLFARGAKRQRVCVTMS